MKGKSKEKTVQEMSLHTELLQQAKLNQINDLKQSSIYLKQLMNSIYAVIKSNSDNSSNNTSSLLDKITTIHQLNKEIDRQLNEDIAMNYYELMKYKKQLNRMIQECHQILNGNGPGSNIINELQTRSEYIDQDLRILEHTLKLIKK